MQRLSVIRTVLFLFFSFSLVNAQPPDPVTISVTGGPVEIPAGSARSVTMQVQIDKPWHINSHVPNDPSLIASKVTVNADGLTLSRVDYPVPHDVVFGFSDQPVSVFQGTFDVKLRLTAAADAVPGARSVTVTLLYQACDDQTCLAPKRITAEAQVMVVAAAAGEQTVAQEAPSDPQDPAAAAAPETLQTFAGAPASATQEDSLAATLERSGLALSLLLIFLGGLALNLTPCVYPLIPITIGYFGGQSEGRTSRLFLLGVLYMLGMALTYSVIGVVTSLSGALFGTLLQNIYVIIGIALLFVVLALSQFGVYEFNLPSSWMAAAGGAKGGAYGAFFMGLTMGIVAAPCIGPFVLGLVTFVAAKGDPFQGFLMFFVLAIGLGLPYLVLALFSGKIKNLPRSGEWMEGVKHLFGFIMLGMALYFLDPVLPNEVRPYVLPVFGLLAAVILIFIDRTGNSVKGFRTVKVLLMLAVAGLSVYALVPSEQLKPDWKPFSEAAYEQSLKANDVMVIDFYADWCIPCKELDALTFSDPSVIDASRRFTMYKADLTRSDDPATEALTKRFAIKGVPTILIIDANGAERDRITGFVDAAEFLRRLSAVQ
ncbi:MAG: protein-disulfide reductase DsbD [Bacteroidetes bacterium]|nr:protein-disulfide reductase DsbD [Bacteroidota bacterium]